MAFYIKTLFLVCSYNYLLVLFSAELQCILSFPIFISLYCKNIILAIVFQFVVLLFLFKSPIKNLHLVYVDWSLSFFNTTLDNSFFLYFWKLSARAWPNSFFFWAPLSEGNEPYLLLSGWIQNANSGPAESLLFSLIYTPWLPAVLVFQESFWTIGNNLKNCRECVPKSCFEASTMIISF